MNTTSKTTKSSSIKHPSPFCPSAKGGEGLGGLMIIAVVGPSGAGKDTFARMLSDKTGIELLVSYTTRPMREGEVDGREHHFVKRACAKKQMLAYTEYGGFKYWTTTDQINGKCIYVIDEKGLQFVRETFPEIKIISIKVTASEDVRRERGVSEERITRDKERLQLPNSAFDYIVKNNKSMDALKHQLNEIAIKLR